MAKAKQVVKGKVLKKEWHPIKSTKAFDSTFLGESYVSGPDMLIGRVLTINLANLSGDIRQQGISLKFKISSIDDGAGVADVIGYEASSAQLKRLVRRGVERLDDTIICKISGGKSVKIKPFAVTKTGTSKSKLTSIRKMLNRAISAELATQDFDSLIKTVISNKLQASLKASAKKVFPLRALEIRKMELLDGVEPTEEAPAEETPAESSPEAPSEKPAEQAPEK